jgi:importin subunit beta-1
VQGLLCGVLQVIVQRLSDVESMKPAVVGMADAIMEALLTVFACRNATVNEEALLAAGSLTYATGKGFAKYMEAFYPVLEMALTNYQVYTAFLLGLGRMFFLVVITSQARCHARSGLC